MSRWANGPVRAGLALGLFFLLTTTIYAVQATNKIEIRSVEVNGKPLPLREGRKLILNSPENSLSFHFGPARGDAHPPLRLRCQLEGFENTWHEGDGFMFLAVRYFNAAGDQIDQINFQVTGESAGLGWRVEDRGADAPPGNTGGADQRGPGLGGDFLGRPARGRGHLRGGQPGHVRVLQELIRHFVAITV
jgi:hypothetical protein